MKTNLHSARVRPIGDGGFAQRTAAGFVVLGSADARDLVPLIEANQSEPDLIELVAEKVMSASVEAFAMLFTSGGELFLLAWGATQATIDSTTSRLVISAQPGQILIERLNFGVSDKGGSVRLTRDATLVARAPAADARADLESGTKPADAVEISLAVPGAAEAKDGAFERAVEEAEADRVEPPELPSTPPPPAAQDILFAEDLDELAGLVDSPETDSSEQGASQELSSAFDRGGPAAQPAAGDLASNLASGQPAQPAAGDLASNLASGQPAQPAAGDLASNLASGQPAQPAAGDLASNLASGQPAQPAAGDLASNLVGGQSAQPAAGDLASNLVGGQSAQPAAGDNPAEAIAAEASTAPVMVLGIACPQGHHNHPDALYCSQCGTKMGVHNTTVLLNGPRPPLGVLIVDDGTTLSISSDLVVGREPSTHPDVVAGTAAAMALTDDTLSLSRRHARILLEDWSVFVTDLHSSNGTWLNRDRAVDEWSPVPSDVAVALEPGDRLRIGGRIIQVELHHVR